MSSWLDWAQPLPPRREDTKSHQVFGCGWGAPCGIRFNVERSKRFLIILTFGVILLSDHWVFSQRLPAVTDGEEAGLYQSWLLSDLDGDNRLDLALGRSAAAGYTVEIRYSNHPETVLLALGRGATVVRCVQLDVDRDNDQDLIVSSIGVLEYRAVWINDGQGHFSRSDKSANVYLPVSGLTSSLELKCEPLDGATFNLTERFPVDRAQRNCTCPIMGSETSVVVGPQGPISKLAPGKLVTRGPPPS